MEPEKTSPASEVQPSTTAAAVDLSAAFEDIKLTPVGLGITELPLNSPSNSRQNERRPSSADADGNWRDRSGDGDKVTGSNHQDGGDNPEMKEKVNQKTLLFTDQRDIGNFLTQKEIPPRTGIPMPLMMDNALKKLLPKDEIEAMKGKHLGVLYEDSIKIMNYIEFSEIKQTLFYRWLLDHSYFQNVGPEKKWKTPGFIANEGRIVDALLTPLRKPNGWQFYAIKYQDIIFMSSVDYLNQQKSTLESHCGYVYREMITGGKPESEIINEFDKLLAATEVTFGDHQLLIVSETDGVDDQGDGVKIRAYKPVNRFAPLWAQKVEKSKFLKFWAVSLIPGVKTLVLGHRDEKQLLQSTKYLATESLWEMAKLGENSKRRCYTFTDRLLKFIQEQFVGNDRFKVKLFKWEGVPRNRNLKKEFDRDSTNKTQTGINSESKKEKEESPTTNEVTENNAEINHAVRDQEQESSPKAGVVRGRVSRPHVDLENASVICTTIVDPAEMKRVSEFILPDWFVDAAFNQTEATD